MNWWSKLPNSVQHMLWAYAIGKQTQTSGTPGQMQAWPAVCSDGSIQWPPDETMQNWLCKGKILLDEYKGNASC